MTTLEDLDRRVDAMHRVIAESEVRLKAEVTATELRLGAKISETELRLENRLSGIDQRIAAAQRETTGLLNDFRQEILAAIDRLANPPK
jgi:predicted  nucleic acid-binding Zn-ribbon protein